MTRKKIIIIVVLFLAFAGLIAYNRIKVYRHYTEYFDGMDWNTLGGTVEGYAWKADEGYVCKSEIINGQDTDLYSFSSSKYSKYGDSEIKMTVVEDRLRAVEAVIDIYDGASKDKLYEKYRRIFKRASQSVQTDNGVLFEGNNSDTIYYLAIDGERVIIRYRYNDLGGRND